MGLISIFISVEYFYIFVSHKGPPEKKMLVSTSDSTFEASAGESVDPLSWVMEMAAIMDIALANGGGKPLDWEDFVGIIVSLVINSSSKKTPATRRLHSWPELPPKLRYNLF